MGSGHMDDQRPSAGRRLALVDGNSFYCSCERVMRPSLEGRPLIVLSNNDGCAIARTAEAKALGIGMGDPWFKIRPLVDQGLIALSANFSLYGDLSDRMMNVVGQFAPAQEIYSIDESFLDLTGVPGSGREIGTAIRERVRQWVGIPTCVGIGPTKTLAKLANHLAKRIPRLQGVCDLAKLDETSRLRALRHVQIEDVWGVGRRLAPRLRALDIQTAADLAVADLAQIRAEFSVVLARTARELAGEECIPWDDEPADKQQIMCSRSFGRPVQAESDLREAIATFVTRAAEKLRAQSSYTDALQVFIRTSPFRQGPQRTGSTVVRLSPTHDTNTLIAAALKGLQLIYKPDFAYTKAGVCALSIISSDAVDAQGSLFSSEIELPAVNRTKLMQVIDQVNTRYGRGTLVAGQVVSALESPWRMRQERRTPAYTTDWTQLVQIWR